MRGVSMAILHAKAKACAQYYQDNFHVSTACFHTKAIHTIFAQTLLKSGIKSQFTQLLPTLQAAQTSIGKPQYTQIVRLIYAC